MARTRKKELPTAQLAEHAEASSQEHITEHLPDTATDFNPAELERQHNHQQQAAEIVQDVADSTVIPESNGHHTGNHKPHREHGQSHAQAVGKRQPRYNEQGITDNLAGVKLLEHHDPYLSVMRFDEKPSDAVRQKLRDGGFEWNSPNKEWVRQINYETRVQDRIHADRVFEDVTKMIREERGITHSYGTPG